MAKIKVRPEDFVVDELINISLAENGRYTILKLEKRFCFCARSSQYQTTLLFQIRMMLEPRKFQTI